VEGVLPHPINDVGEKHLGDYISGNPQIFISQCFTLPHHQAGRSIRIGKSWLSYKIDRPDASPLQNFSVWGLTLPSSFTCVKNHKRSLASSTADIGSFIQEIGYRNEAIAHNELSAIALCVPESFRHRE
jgi:hypothetical protein